MTVLATYQNISRVRRAEAESSRGPSADLPNALPLGQTGSGDKRAVPVLIYSAVTCLLKCCIHNAALHTQEGKESKQFKTGVIHHFLTCRVSVDAWAFRCLAWAD